MLAFGALAVNLCLPPTLTCSLSKLMAFLAAKKLSPHKLYRINRYDVPAEIPTLVPLDEQLAYCQDHILRGL